MATNRPVFFGAVAVLGAVITACSPGARAPGGLQPGAAEGIGPGATVGAIDSADARLRVAILAADSMAGRETGTPGAASAARYLTAELARLRLRPAGDNGSFLQSVPLEKRITSATVTATGPAGIRSLGPDEILPVSGLGGLPRAARTEGSGPLVFGGYLADPDVGDSELQASQLTSAIVVVRLGAPEGVDPATAQPRPLMAALFSPFSPVSAVILIAEETEAEFWDYAAEIGRKGAVSLAGGSNDGIAAPPFFLVTPEAAERLIGRTLAEARQPMADLGSMQFSLDERVEPVEGWNVAAIVPGADPARAGQYVALGAHYDHVGIGAAVDGDSIYNGADDNASGTSALLEVAEALATLPADQRPARSVLFVWNAAEESGLLGSEHFTDNPTVARDSIIAHINLDMVGRNDPDSLFSVGSRRLSTELGDIVEAVNARQPRPFSFDYSYDVPGHPEQIYCRSDHYNYARYGIPIVFFTSGLHDQYHAPSDHAELIDAAKVARVSSLVLDITLELANRDARPVVDQPVPPPGAPCT